MLPNKYKLKLESDFNKVYRLGKRKNFPFFTLRYFINSRLETKIAVVASIKEIGKANKRNFARRRVWAGLRKTIKVLPKKGFLLIFTTKKPILNASWANVSKDIEYTIDNLANISKM